MNGEVNGLASAKSFVRYAKRGTWFNRMYGRCYELDGFVVRQNEGHRLVRRMRSDCINEFLDHKPKKVEYEWRGRGGKR